MAELYRDQGRYAEAEPLYRRAITTEEKALGANHPEIAALLITWRNCSAKRSLRRRGATPTPRARYLQNGAHPEHPDTASGLNSLALLYRKQGRLSEAQSLLRRALDIYENALGPIHPDVATALNNLALLCPRGTPVLYHRAITIYERALGPEHPYTATGLHNLALQYYYMGRYTDAECLFRRSLVIRERAFGPEHPEIASCLSSLADYFDQGRYAEATSLRRQALIIREATLGLEHPYTATSLSNLALTYDSQSLFDDAEPLYRQALAIYEKSFRRIPNRQAAREPLQDVVLAFCGIGGLLKLGLRKSLASSCGEAIQ